MICGLGVSERAEEKREQTLRPCLIYFGRIEPIDIELVDARFCPSELPVSEKSAEMRYKFARTFVGIGNMEEHSLCSKKYFIRIHLHLSHLVERHLIRAAILDSYLLINNEFSCFWVFEVTRPL